jgi:hypothetical protein
MNVAESSQADEKSAASEIPVGERRHERGARAPDEVGYRPFVPLLLMVLATATWFAFQCYQLVRERASLATSFASQSRQLEDSGKMRGSLEAIARDTALLASKGNPGAKLVVDELARRGIMINPALQGNIAPK